MVLEECLEARWELGPSSSEVFHERASLETCLQQGQPFPLLFDPTYGAAAPLLQT